MIKISRLKIKKSILAMLIAVISAILTGFILYVYTFKIRFFQMI